MVLVIFQTDNWEAFMVEVLSVFVFVPVPVVVGVVAAPAAGVVAVVGVVASLGVVAVAGVVAVPVVAVPATR